MRTTEKIQHDRLMALLDTCHSTLRLVASGIHRATPTRNICWLHGDGAAVHEVESTLKQLDIYLKQTSTKS